MLVKNQFTTYTRIFEILNTFLQNLILNEAIDSKVNLLNDF